MRIREETPFLSVDNGSRDSETSSKAGYDDMTEHSQEWENKG